MKSEEKPIEIKPPSQAFRVGEIITKAGTNVLFRVTKVILDDNGDAVDYEFIDANFPNRKQRRKNHSPNVTTLNKTQR